MRLIDADELSKVRPFLVVGGPIGDYTEGFVDCAEEARGAIKNAPTISAVPVVRCRECKRWDADPDSYGKDDGPKGKCMKSFEETYDDDFCSYGQRKTETVPPKSDAKNCKTCKWHDDVMGLCYNWNSPHLADKTDPEQKCCEWTQKEANHEVS